MDTLKLAKKANLASLKSDIDDKYNDKLEAVPVDLKKLNDAVDKNILKKMKCNTDKQSLDKKIGR